MAIRDPRVALLLAMPLLGHCTADTAKLDGLPCGADGTCVGEYVCHPETNRCVHPVSADCALAGATCPSTVNDGDPCPTLGSFIPCTDDATDCSTGCRTCESSGWSACSVGICDTCTTFYRDDDRDGLGLASDSQCVCEASAPYDATVSGDCDDALPHCTTDCTDGDSDDWCFGIDCDDGSSACTSDCAACPPTTLVLTVTNASPIATGDTVTLEIDLGSYTRDASTEITCTATTYTLFGPVSFAGYVGSSDIGTLGMAWTNGEWASQPEIPFDKTACSTAGEFVRLTKNNAGANLRLDPLLALSNYGNLNLSFIAAVEDGFDTNIPSSDQLDVEACCNTGGNCTMASVLEVHPSDIGGTNACSSPLQTSLPYDECLGLGVRWSWPKKPNVVAGIDNIQIDGGVIVPDVTVASPGLYTSSFIAGPPGSFTVTCTWENTSIGSSLDDDAGVTIE